MALNSSSPCAPEKTRVKKVEVRIGTLELGNVKSQLNALDLQERTARTEKGAVKPE